MQRGGLLLTAREIGAQLGGGRLCYAEPVRAGERIVIGVSRVSASGGGGFGRSDKASDVGAGGGGGGMIDAAPVGFIEIGPEGARFEAIPDPAGTARAVRSGATALTTIATAAAWLLARRRAGRGATRGLLARRSAG